MNRSSTDTAANLQRALEAAEKGYVPIPMLPGSKVPAVKWKRWQSEMPTEELLREWFADARRNIAIVTTGLVIFDCDDPTKAELVLRECGQTPHVLKTPRGIHLGYRRRRGVELMNEVDIKGMEIDIRTDGGLEMLPESVTPMGRYEWLGQGLRRKEELPVARIGWTRERSRRKARHLVEPLLDGTALEADRASLVRRARAYLATVEGAISGQRGHDRTFRVACILAHKFGLGFEEAWPIFLEWNQTCEPPWSERDLAHKLSDAINKRR